MPKPNVHFLEVYLVSEEVSMCLLLANARPALMGAFKSVTRFLIDDYSIILVPLVMNLQLLSALFKRNIFTMFSWFYRMEYSFLFVWVISFMSKVRSIVDLLIFFRHLFFACSCWRYVQYNKCLEWVLILLCSYSSPTSLDCRESNLHLS